MNKVVKRFLVALVVLTIMSVAGGAAYFSSIWNQIYSQEINDINIDNDDERPDPNPNPTKNITNVLILGVDQLSNEPARSDAIMLLSYYRDQGEMSLVSIPRDTRVNIPGRGLDKINHAMAFGGSSLMLRTVEDLLDIKIDYYISTNFQGFAKVVDIVGGVELDVERRMVYLEDLDYPIDLHPGLQTLDGDKALQYVRYRGDSSGDWGRVERQQNFLKTLIGEAYHVKNITRVPQLMETMSKYVKTNMPLKEIFSLAQKSRSMELNEIYTQTIPGRNTYINNVSYIEPDFSGIKGIVQDYIYWENKSESESS